MSIFECNSKMTRLEFINEYIEHYKDTVINTDKISDGFHTFGELYHHRSILFASLCRAHKEKAWKSRKHNDGEYPFFDKDWFIVGITTPKGDYTYHYHMENWKYFEGIQELEVGKKWDGHQPKDIIRLLSL